MVDLARMASAKAENRVPSLGAIPSSLTDRAILPISEIQTSYYLRLSALDKPGVLSKVTQILSDRGISIEALIQKEPAAGQEAVPIIVLTNIVKEQAMDSAIGDIQALEAVVGAVVRIRVESLD